MRAFLLIMVLALAPFCNAAEAKPTSVMKQDGVLRLKGKYTENHEAIFPFQVYDESGLLIRELKSNSELLGQMISLL